MDGVQVSKKFIRPGLGKESILLPVSMGHCLLYLILKSTQYWTVSLYRQYILHHIRWRRWVYHRSLRPPKSRCMLRLKKRVWTESLVIDPLWRHIWFETSCSRIYVFWGSMLKNEIFSWHSIWIHLKIDPKTCFQFNIFF